MEDLLTADLSCHTLFPFSSNYSAVRQSHCKASWEINPCVQLLQNLCVGFLWHKTHFHVNVNHVFHGASNQVSSTQLVRHMCLRERIFYFFFVFWHNARLHQQRIISWLWILLHCAKFTPFLARFKIYITCPVITDKDSSKNGILSDIQESLTVHFVELLYALPARNLFIASSWDVLQRHCTCTEKG